MQYKYIVLYLHFDFIFIFKTVIIIFSKPHEENVLIKKLNNKIAQIT